MEEITQPYEEFEDYTAVSADVFVLEGQLFTIEYKISVQLINKKFNPIIGIINLN